MSMETAVEESRQVAKGVVDIIVAQGHEVGGHSLTFDKISY
jgi:NAD(P)H-dependent flavin oxidoreductase YrpB (nitropropane dioxygenase family)